MVPRFECCRSNFRHRIGKCLRSIVVFCRPPHLQVCTKGKWRGEENIRTNRWSKNRAYPPLRHGAIGRVGDRLYWRMEGLGPVAISMLDNDLCPLPWSYVYVFCTQTGGTEEPSLLVRSPPMT